MAAPRGRRSASVACAAALALAAACDQSTEPPAERTPPFTFTGVWAGQPWAGDAEARLVPGGPTGDTLYVFGGRRPIDGRPVPEQWIRVRVVIAGPGAYALDAEAVEVTDLIGGDVAVSQYEGRGPASGELHIDAYEGVGGIVEGTVRFEAQPASRNAPYGPETRFESGWFRATVTPLR